MKNVYGFLNYNIQKCNTFKIANLEFSIYLNSIQRYEIKNATSLFYEVAFFYFLKLNLSIQAFRSI